MQYFVVMIDYGRRGREAIVDPEITRREVVSRIASGEYKNISFIHEVADRLGRGHHRGYSGGGRPNATAEIASSETANFRPRPSTM